MTRLFGWFVGIIFGEFDFVMKKEILVPVDAKYVNARIEEIKFKAEVVNKELLQQLEELKVAINKQK